MPRCFASLRFDKSFAMTGLLFAVAVHSAAAAETVTLRLASGRERTGFIDPRTDDAHLWLRSEADSITMLRPIDWERIVSAQIGNKRLSRDELRAAAAGLKTPEASLEARDSSTPASAPRESAIRPQSAAPPPLVRAIQIDAALGHWEPGVEATGIVVTVYPIDADGRLVPVDGTLDVDLVGQRLTTVADSNGFPQIGRWTAAVRSSDFGPSGAVYRLAFQAVHPDFQFELDPHGLTHARLSVPGQGTFEASQSLMRIRDYSPVRDHLQQDTGSRFLPIERVENPR